MKMFQTKIIEESASMIELKRLELQEKEKEHKAQLQMKELKIKECEIAVQLKK